MCEMLDEVSGCRPSIEKSSQITQNHPQNPCPIFRPPRRPPARPPEKSTRARRQSKEKPTEGVVIAMGPGKTHPETGVAVDLPCAVGDKVRGDGDGDGGGGYIAA